MCRGGRNGKAHLGYGGGDVDAPRRGIQVTRKDERDLRSTDEGVKKMTTRMKPILGMWAALMVLSVAAAYLRPEVWAGDNAMFGQWPTIAILWLITAVYFDWVVQSTGMGATQAAIVLAAGAIIAGGVLTGWMFFGREVGVAATNAVQTLIFWYASAVVYGKLSS